MKIAVVTPACHFPSRGAVQQDIYAMLSFLKKMGHTVSVFSLDQPGQDRAVLQSVRDEYQIDITVYLPSLKFITWLKTVIFQPIFFDRSAYAFYEAARSVDFIKYLDTYKPDLLISIGNYSWPLFSECKKRHIRFVIRSHNFEPLHYWEELTVREKCNPIHWVKFLAKWWSERKSVNVADRIAAISPREVNQYTTWQVGKALLLPLVSLSGFRANHKVAATKKPLDVFFLGATYNVPFHRRGAEQLINHIAPEVARQAPGEFRFHVCGGKLPAYLVQACDDNSVVYEGFVPDLNAFFDRMDAGVFPVWSGRGMKQKIFESIARGFPIVAPRISLGEYPVVSGESALIADKPEDMVAMILRLRDPEVRARLSAGAAKFSQQWFSQEKFQEYFSALFDSTE